MKAAIVLVLCLAAQSCSKKETVSETVSQSKLTLPSQSSKATIRGAASTPESIRHEAKRVLQDPSKRTSLAVDQYARKIADAENVSYPEALSELYEIVSGGQRHGDSHYSGLFYHLIFDESEKVAATIGALPSGGLRQLCIGFIRGSNLDVEKVAEIYEAMPESQDRTHVAKIYIDSLYFRDGTSSAIRALVSLETSDEQKHALDALASQMAGSYKLRKGEISAKDMQQVRELSRKYGQEDRISFYFKDIQTE